MYKKYRVTYCFVWVQNPVSCPTGSEHILRTGCRREYLDPRERK